MRSIIKKIFIYSLSTLLVYPCFADSPDIKTKWMDKNPCFTSEKRTIKPTGIMVHSTASPGVMALDWYDCWNKTLEEGGQEAAVHAFVDDKNIVQYLPWRLRSWHCGRGVNGSCNDTCISIEMCEPASITYSDPNTIDESYNPDDPDNKAYFNAALKNMVELCAYLAKKFEISLDNIICHKEGHQKGMASDHVDVLHWWPLHKVDMDIFRDLVGQELDGQTIDYNF